MIVIDAGNTNIVIGFYTKNKLNKIIRLKTEKKINITRKEINQKFNSLKVVQPSDEEVLQDYADIQSERFAVSEKTKTKWNEVVKKEEDES